MIGPVAAVGWGATFPPDDAEYSAIRRIEDGVACTWIHEETMHCSVCGQFTLARDHFWEVHADGRVEEFGHADRCVACEPFLSCMPSIVAAREMRKRIVA